MAALSMAVFPNGRIVSFDLCSESLVPYLFLAVKQHYGYRLREIAQSDHKRLDFAVHPR